MGFDMLTKMIIELERDTFTSKSTMGTLFVPTIEQLPQLRVFSGELPTHWGGERNVRGHTCYLPGLYDLELVYWDKYAMTMPLLSEVPGRSEVFIHPANDMLKELLGCTAVGMTRGEDRLEDSRRAFFQVRDRIVVAKALGMRVQLHAYEKGGLVR